MGLGTAIVGLFKGQNPIKEILSEVDNLATSAEEKAILRKDIVLGLVEAQMSVIKSEYEHGSWLSRSWRPLTMLAFVTIVLYAKFLGPMFDLRVVPLDPELWTLIKVGLGGYIGLRSAEKVTNTLVPSFRMAKLKKKMIAKGLDPELLD